MRTPKVQWGLWDRLLVSCREKPECHRAPLPTGIFRCRGEVWFICFQAGWCGWLKLRYVDPGEIGLCLGSAWHLINGGYQCSDWKSEFLFSWAPGITSWSLLVVVTAAHYTRPCRSGHPSRCFSRLPECGNTHWLQTWFEPCSCCMTLGKSLSHSEPHVPICTARILMPAEGLGQSWESRASTCEAIHSL